MTNSAIVLHRPAPLAAIDTTTTNGLTEWFQEQFATVDNIGTTVRSSRNRRKWTGPALTVALGVAASPLGLGAVCAAAALPLITVTLPAFWNPRAVLGNLGFINPDERGELSMVQSRYEHLVPEQRALWLICHPSFLRPAMAVVLRGRSEDSQEAVVDIAKSILQKRIFEELLDDPHTYVTAQGTKNYQEDFLSLLSNALPDMPDTVTASHKSKGSERGVIDATWRELPVVNAPNGVTPQPTNQQTPSLVPQHLRHKVEALASQGFDLRPVLNSSITLYIGNGQSGKTSLMAMVTALRHACGFQNYFITTDEAPRVPWDGVTAPDGKDDGIALDAVKKLANEIAAAPNHSWNKRSYVIDEYFRMTEGDKDAAVSVLSKVLQKGPKTDACFSFLSQSRTTKGLGSSGNTQALFSEATVIQAQKKRDEDGRRRAAGIYTVTIPGDGNEPDEVFTLTTPDFIKNAADPVAAFCDYLGVEVTIPVTPVEEVSEPDVELTDLQVQLIELLKRYPDGLPVSQIKKEHRIPTLRTIPKVRDLVSNIPHLVEESTRAGDNTTIFRAI